MGEKCTGPGRGCRAGTERPCGAALPLRHAGPGRARPKQPGGRAAQGWPPPRSPPHPQAGRGRRGSGRLAAKGQQQPRSCPRCLGGCALGSSALSKRPGPGPGPELSSVGTHARRAWPRPGAGLASPCASGRRDAGMWAARAMALSGPRRSALQIRLRPGVCVVPGHPAAPPRPPSQVSSQGQAGQTPRTAGRTWGGPWAEAGCCPLPGPPALSVFSSLPYVSEVLAATSHDGCTPAGGRGAGGRDEGPQSPPRDSGHVRTPHRPPQGGREGRRLVLPGTVWAACGQR